jgi:hypothetical protein
MTTKEQATATADSSASLRNDKQKNRQQQGNRRSLRDDKQENRQRQGPLQPQIPPLRCGMTTKERATARQAHILRDGNQKDIQKQEQLHLRNTVIRLPIVG